jgi:hypothetical protein
MLNDRPQKTAGGTVTVRIAAGRSSLDLLNWDFGELEQQTNLAGPTVRFKIPRWKTDRFKLILRVKGSSEFDSEYTLLYRSRDSAENARTPENDRKRRMN